MQQVDIGKLDDILENSVPAFLCGNGFSVNFSDDFFNIYDRLFEAHKILMKKKRYVITSNTILKSILKDNYNAVFEYLYSAKEEDI